MYGTNNQKEINVGVDTGKFQLDIHIRPLDIFLTVQNDETGIKKAISEIKKHKPTRVIIEATGRLEHAFILACSKANLPFAVANPAHIKKFAGAIGRLAKTDKLDAQLIAHYGEAVKPVLSTLKPESMRLMSDLLSRRRQLMSMQTMEKNRLQIMPKAIINSIKPILTVIKNQLEKIDNKLNKLITDCDEYDTKNTIIQSMPGVGNVVAFNLLCDMPELGYLTNKQAAALIGVAPINRESGTFVGKRTVRGGRNNIRTVMYMAMMSAMQCNAILFSKPHISALLQLENPRKWLLLPALEK